MDTKALTDHLIKTLTEQFMKGMDMEQQKQNDGAFDKKDIAIVRQGKAIVLPDDPRAMTYAEARQHLQRIEEQENIKINVHEEVDAFPLEGAWALNQVLREMFGFVLTPEAQMSFFGGERPSATLVTLEVGPNKKEQVLWGQFKVPGVDGTLETGATIKNGFLSFVISGVIKKRDQTVLKEVADRVRQYVAANSLYKSKAVKITTLWNDETEKYELNAKHPPQFLDLDRVNENELVFSDDVADLIETNLFVPVEQTDKCRALRVPLRRNILLDGPYGTGKTLTAFVSAKKAQANGWTFIYLDRVEALKDALLFARRYAPAIIFAEDVEGAVSGGRNTSVNDILNTIDGIDAKNQEVMCIFTTNHIEKIEKAMLRPGRLDAVITVQPPDAKAAEKLIRIYSRGLIAESEDVSEAACELSGQIPAMIRETVERSKLFAIKNHIVGEELRISGNNVRLAAIQMKSHMSLIANKGPKKLSNGEQLERILASLLEKHENGAFNFNDAYEVESDDTVSETTANMAHYNELPN